MERAVLKITEREIERLIARKAKEAGCSPSAKDCRSILTKLKSGSSTFRIRRWRFWEKGRRVAIQIDAKEIGAIEAEIETALPAIIEKVSDDVVPHLAKALTRQWRTERRSRAREGRDVLKRISREWGHALDLLGMILAVTEELAGDLSNDETIERDARHEAVIRATGRACRVVGEVLALVRAGFPDGGLARWRTVHELTIVVEFLAENSVETAEAYLLHALEEERREEAAYSRFSEALGTTPVEPDEMEESVHSMLLERFGTVFEQDCGWAADTLKKKKVTFADIERSVEAEHFRAPYKTASRGVHAGAAGVGDLLKHLDTGALLSGPSLVGISAPVYLVAVSLTRAAAALAALQPSLDNLIAVKVLCKFFESLNADIDANSDA